MEFLIKDGFDGCDFMLFKLRFDVKFNVERRDMRFVDVGSV